MSGTRHPRKRARLATNHARNVKEWKGDSTWKPAERPSVAGERAPIAAHEAQEMSRDDRIEFTVRLYPREIVYWDDPRHTRHKEQDMEPPTKGCGKHACTDHERCRAVTAACGCEECALAMELYQRASASPPVCGDEFTPRGSDYMIRVVCERERGHDGYHGTVPVTDGGTAIGDPTTAAIEERNRELARYRGECVRALEALVASTPDGPEVHGVPRTLAGLVNLTIQRVGRLTRERDEARKDLADAERTFEIVKDSDRRAIAMFKEAHPDSRVTFPDRANMLVWILEQLDSVTRELDDKRKNPTLIERGPGMPSQIYENHVARLRSQLTEVLRQRDDAEKGRKVTEDRLEMFIEATAEMAIERMRMTKALALAERGDAAEHPPGTVALLRIEMHKIRKRLDEITEACWSAVEAVPPDAGIGYWSERSVDVEAAVGQAIKGLTDRLGDTIEALRVADADRVPLRMDLDAAQAALKTMRESMGRMASLVDAAIAYVKHGTDGITEAVNAYEVACDQASKPSADPAADDMPF